MSLTTYMNELIRILIGFCSYYSCISSILPLFSSKNSNYENLTILLLLLYYYFIITCKNIKSMKADFYINSFGANDS